MDPISFAAAAAAGMERGDDEAKGPWTQEVSSHGMELLSRVPCCNSRANSRNQQPPKPPLLGLDIWNEPDRQNLNSHLAPVMPVLMLNAVITVAGG